MALSAPPLQSGSLRQTNSVEAELTNPDIQSNHINSNSPEQLFWRLKPVAQKAGIAPSRMGQLAKLCNDWENARQMLTSVLKSKEPSAYLGAMIKSMKDDLKPLCSDPGRA